MNPAFPAERRGKNDLAFGAERCFHGKILSYFRLLSTGAFEEYRLEECEEKSGVFGVHCRPPKTAAAEPHGNPAAVRKARR